MKKLGSEMSEHMIDLYEDVREMEPRELAKLLGHLVFASQVVPGGRTYMQNMLSAFSGLEVDWKHGRVRARYGAWDLVTLRMMAMAHGGQFSGASCHRQKAHF